MNLIPNILLVDDDDATASLISMNLRRNGLRNIKRGKNGREALELLAALDKHPTVMLLDIRMPELDGIQVLRQRAQVDSNYRVPIIMMTTSENPREIDQCYQLGCNLYLQKPVNYAEFTKLIQELAAFIRLICLPGAELNNE